MTDPCCSIGGTTQKARQRVDLRQRTAILCHLGLSAAKTALVTTEGFRDTLEIGRGSRPESFNLFYRRLAPLVPRDLRFEIRERMSARARLPISKREETR